LIAPRDIHMVMRAVVIEMMRGQVMHGL